MILCNFFVGVVDLELILCLESSHNLVFPVLADGSTCESSMWEVVKLCDVLKCGFYLVEYPRIVIGWKLRCFAASSVKFGFAS